MPTLTEAIDQIATGVRAKFPLTWVASIEEEAIVESIRSSVEGEVFAWSFTSGVRPVNNRALSPSSPVYATDDETKKAGGVVGEADPDVLFAWIKGRCQKKAEERVLSDKHKGSKPNDTTLVLLEFDEFLGEAPLVRRAFREMLANNILIRPNINLIMISPRHEIPQSLRDLTVLVEPSAGSSAEHAKYIATSLSRQNAMMAARPGVSKPVLYALSPEEITRCANVAAGLTREAVRRAYLRALNSGIKPVDGEFPFFGPFSAALAESKRDMIQGLGFLQYEEARESMSTVGGQGLLKDWLRKRVKAFGPAAKDYGLAEPKGVLVVGPPGTGKSLGARAASALWGRPLIRLDVGALFGGLVGESEKNTRHALSVIEAMSPCVLWIDEIEKGLSGMGSSGSTDGGTTSRVFQSILTWLNEKSSPVFVFATANDPASLPAELLRKGRFDEIFAILLPTAQERVEIVKIHLSKRNRNAEAFDVAKVAAATEGFSGAEIEQVVIEALYQGFDEGREIVTEDLVRAAKDTRPLSQTMSERIEYMQAWAKERARPASAPAVVLPPIDVMGSGYSDEVTGSFL